MNRLMVLLSIITMGAGSAWAQSSGTGTKADPFIIANSTDLNTFGSKMNKNTAYWKLSADIDLNGAEWTYGKNSAAIFQGHFDGNNKTIKNFKIIPTSAKNNGFFCALQGTVDSRAEVKNLTIDSVTILQTGNLDNNTITGALAGNVTEYTDIDSVTVKNVSISFVNLTKTNYIGAFAGRVEKNNSAIAHCAVVSPSIDVSGEISGGASYIGGAIGQFAGSANLLSTIDSLVVSSPSVTINKISIKDSYVGAVFGRFNTYCTIDKVIVSKPTLVYKNTDAPNVALNLGTFAAGIVGTGNQRVDVTNVTVTGDAKLTIGSNNKVQNIKAGLIGTSYTNVFLKGWTIENTSVDIKGSLATTGCSIGGFTGHTLPQDADNAQFVTDDVKITGKSTISVSEDISVASNIGGLVGYMQGRSKTESLNKMSNVTVADVEITVGGKCSIKEIRIGGLIGYVNTGCSITDCKITKASKLTLKGDIGAVCYFGGAIGDFAGSNGFPSTVKTLTVTKPSVSVNKYSAGTSLTGGVFGRVSTYTTVDGVTLSGASLKFSNDLGVAQQIGTFAGTITGNATKQISVKNVTIDKSELTFGSSATSNTIGLKAGLIGQVSTNVLLDTWTVSGDSKITINGNLATTASYLGGFVGYSSTGSDGPIDIKNIEIGDTISINVTGKISVASYIGGLIGQATQANSDKNQTIISNIEAKKAVTISVDGDITAGSYLGGFAGYIYSRSMTGCSSTIKQVTLNTSNITVTGKITAGSYVGGLVAYATTGCAFDDWKITSDAKVTLNDNITAASYVSGAIARFDGTAAYPSTATALKINKPAITINGNVTNSLYLGGLVGYQTISTLKDSKVTGGDITLNGNTTTGLYIGGAVGWLNPTAAPYALVQGVEVKSTKIHSSGSHTYAKGNKPLAVGGVVGYMGQTSTTFTEVRNCVADTVDIDFSSMIPEAGNTSGSLYNQQQNAFTIGGVIGRINTPSRLPERLFYSGKIYAPFATVAPIVGMFFTKINAATYLYDDYSGLSAAYLPSVEWQKAEEWYYGSYKIGLSQALLSQTARTKNYATTSISEENGIKYVNVASLNTTFTQPNKIDGLDKVSYTILAYKNNANEDYGIYPTWNTNSATYPAYYMYYMQGVNRGQYVDPSDVEKIKQAVLIDLGAKITMTLVDKNSDFTIEANRGFVTHTLEISTTGDEVDSYSWIVNGDHVKDGTTETTYDLTPAPNGTIVVVEAYKDDVCVKRAYATVKAVFRVKDVSATTYGSKANPYLIGSADELQLLSYLSTLNESVIWEKDYKSNAHYNKAYYELDDDIDMSSVEDFTPIAFPTSGSYVPVFFFDGVFDGKGHTISGLNQTWSGGLFDYAGLNAMSLGWGLFAYVGNNTATTKVGDGMTSPAVIRNLVIDGATLKHKTDNISFYYNNGATSHSSNCMVGVLAGIVGCNTTINNIEIRNSAITDGGSKEYNLATRILSVGGVIGGIRNLAGSANALTNLKIHHVAANVDISLTNPVSQSETSHTDLAQLNVGGIVGSYVASDAAADKVVPTMPSHTFYSGNITAPKAWISPVLASMRYKDQQSWSFANYSKQWEGNNNTAASQLTVKNAHYYNYRIDSRLVTAFYPENTCDRGAHSIAPHTDGSESAEKYNAKKYQGVNYNARYIDMEGTSLEFLNQGDLGGVYWVWKDGFVHMSDQPYTGAYLTRAADDETNFTANATNGTGSAYRWQISYNGTEWINVEGQTLQTYQATPTGLPRLIVAYVTIEGIEYRTQPEFMQGLASKYEPYIETTEDGTDGYKFAIKWKENEKPTGTMMPTYQWYQSNRTTLFEQQTESSLTLSKTELKDAGSVVWCRIVIKEFGVEVDRYLVKSYPLDATVVFVDGTHGIDNAAGSRERGFKPEIPVKTIDHANSLLKTPENGGNWDNNIIVIMGELTPNSFAFQSNGTNPATLTGKWNGTDYQGVIKLDQINPKDANNKDDEHLLNPIRQPGKNGSNCYVLADTRFEDLMFYGNKKGNTFIELHGRNAIFGKGLVMKNFNVLSSSHGNFDVKSNIIPEFTILLTATNLSEKDIKAYTNRTEPQVVTFESGHYGRIMAGRFTQKFFANKDNSAHSILGSAKHPVWAIVNVDIDNDNQKTDGENVTYSCDINAIIAGLTDGTMYGDYQINLHGGNVSYIVGGNQGNPVNNGNKKYIPIGSNLTVPGEFGQWPNASYFGRTIINVEQGTGLKNIAIGGLYAGGLGREIQAASATAIVNDMYLYGRTEVNIKSGTVTNVYGGGTGGVIGHNPWDAHLPYATTAGDNPDEAIHNGVQYGDNRQGDWSPMTADSKLVAVKLHNLQEGTYQEEDLDLSESSTTVNIMGGTVNGSVYGGGYGYVNGMPYEAAVQGVGSVFGTSNINITGGTINGNVYGGSQGDAQYLNKINKYGQTITHIAEMNGNVNLNIIGNEEKYPTIGGNIYGGGQGIATNDNGEEYLRVATTGNTDLGEKYKTTINITIDLPESVPFTGNIYGGGQLGTVDGSTNVLIKRGTFLGNIFGGGRGEDGHPEKAKVTGSTNVKIGE